MVDSLEVELDPVLLALTNLSEVATSSASDLAELNENLAILRRNRLQGWSWRRIIADAESPNPLALLTKIAADLARACGGFRRALAVGLRREGLQVTEIATLFVVSRQRVSALLRPGAGGDGDGDGEEIDDPDSSEESASEAM
jgi:hypothetical protein